MCRYPPPPRGTQLCGWALRVLFASMLESPLLSSLHGCGVLLSASLFLGYSASPFLVASGPTPCTSMCSQLWDPQPVLLKNVKNRHPSPGVSPRVPRVPTATKVPSFFTFPRLALLQVGGTFEPSPSHALLSGVARNPQGCQRVSKCFLKFSKITCKNSIPLQERLQGCLGCPPASKILPFFTFP